MGNQKFRVNFSEIELAYRKLKSYIYHDNFSLPIRIDLAKYESSGIQDQLNKLHVELNKPDFYSVLDDDIRKIDYRLFPKQFYNQEEESARKSGYYYSNKTLKNEYHIEKTTPFIDCTINIHIFTVLWLMRIGAELDAKLIDNCYGNRLVRNEEGKFEINRIKLFYPYYKRYNSWRDEAIKKAKEIHKLEHDVSILNLDVKDYYHSVNFDLGTIENTFNNADPKNSWMNGVLKRIHKKYYRLLKRDHVLEKDNFKKEFLPIGLISSQVLANYYLKEFDDVLLNKLKPIYYGRYVDDILIVFCNPQNSKQNIVNFIEENLCTESLWSNSNCNLKKVSEEDFEILIGKDKLFFQVKKVKLYEFSPKESINLLQEFENEIKKNSSEFRFQPDDEEIFSSFESSSFRITYSDTVNKLRSIEAFNSNKLGASTHLTKLIKLSMLINKYPKDLLESTNSILRAYFQGQRGLEMSQLWEKLYTFYIVNDAEAELIDCAREQLEAILNIKFVRNNEENKILSEKLQNSLYQILAYSLTMASSLNRSFFSEKIISELREKQFTKFSAQVLKYLTLKFINEYGKYVITSNLLRHYYINFPLLNYCKQKDNFSFVSKKLPTYTSFKLDKIRIKYSPRFIHYHELAIFYQLRIWRKKLEIFSKLYNENECEYLLKKYLELNKLRSTKRYQRSFPNLKLDVPIKIISVFSSTIKDKLKFGIVNDKIDPTNSINSIKNNSNLSLKRFLDLNRILNETIRTKCNILVFPEISIPFQWIPKLCQFSKENNIVVICGVEHFSIQKKVYNYLATILPFNFKKFQNCYPDFRLKKDYAPEEIREIKNIKYRVPRSEMNSEKLRKYVWQNIFFTVLNCYEITDINKRAVFRGLIDFITTIEYNRDLPYFSNITESLARDIHAYVIQVNTSNYGDSRITQPASTALKDIVKLKGGDDSLLITGTIDIKKLREFQDLDFNGQEEYERNNQIFKQTPANYSKSYSRK